MSTTCTPEFSETTAGSSPLTLLTKAIVNETKEPINVTYALEYNKWLEDQGIPQSLCDLLEIGQPKADPCSRAASPSPSTTSTALR